MRLLEARLVAVLAAAVVNCAIVNLDWLVLHQCLVEVLGGVERQETLVDIAGQGEAELAISKGFIAAVTVIVFFIKLLFLFRKYSINYGKPP